MAENELEKNNDKNKSLKLVYPLEMRAAEPVIAPQSPPVSAQMLVFREIQKVCESLLLSQTHRRYARDVSRC